MMDSIGKASISEVILLFLLVFVLPLFFLTLKRLRKYERVFGTVPEEGAPPPSPPVTDASRPVTADVSGDVYPYMVRLPFSDAERVCLAALREAAGPDAEVFPKVAMWEVVEPDDPAPGYLARLHNAKLDFLVCDRTTGMILNGVMFGSGEGVSVSEAEEARKICEAAGLPMALIDKDADQDIDLLKQALGLP